MDITKCGFFSILNLPQILHLEQLYASHEAFEEEMLERYYDLDVLEEELLPILHLVLQSSPRNWYHCRTPIDSLRRRHHHRNDLF